LLVSTASQRAPLPQWRCISQLLTYHAEHAPEAPAILAPGRAPLTYGCLRRHIGEVGETLRAIGINRHERVAMVLTDGPEMAVAFLAVAASATCIPLNPASSADEYATYLADLHTKALLVQAGVPTPARAVARTYGYTIIELVPRPDAEAGLFNLTGVAQNPSVHHEFASSNDIALVLHTSGTTAQPKRVPLTHMNICAAAHSWEVALALTASDRCLDILPLFHIYGLIGTLFASMIAGASVICPPVFSAQSFFASLAEFCPTWYAAVPAMHQVILAHAAQYRDSIALCPLRFIRSGAAPLPPQVLTDLERVFDAPVLKGYGLTEACGRITSDPLPPQPRKPSSVGVVTAPEVAIMDAEGRLLPAGETGEIVVRGPNVMQGYENEPVANQEAFIHDWFRTGDAGYVDVDGYLFITGRLKEIINRGGSTVAPQEVDNVLLRHPAVAQAVTFAVPHVRWGEDVATAVVLRPNASTTEQELRWFVATRLTTVKVPSQVLIVEAIPVGPTGKPQRHTLAAQLGLTGATWLQSTRFPALVVSRTPLEEVLSQLWATVLGLERVESDANFFRLGGDSLLATQLLSRIRNATHTEVSFRTFFETPTVADIARHIATANQAISLRPEPPLVSVPREVPLPLSYAQQRLWFLEQIGLSRHAYNLLEARQLCGLLEVAALEQSLQAIVKRHESLHTTFTSVAGQPLQVIGSTSHLSMSVVDLRNLSQHAQEAQVYTLGQAAVQGPFDLEHGPLLRATLLQLADDKYVLLLAMHHIVSDAWSQGVFWRELAVLYAAFASGAPSPLPALSIQYADFAHWQQQWLQGEVLETQLAYWKPQLAGMSTLQLPTDHSRPAVQTFRGARHFLTIPLTLTQALKTLSQRHGVTLFMTLLAAFQTLLHRYTGQDDIAVGSLIANRNRVDLESLIGFFVNTLVLRTDLSGDPSFQALLARVRTVTLGAYEHQDMPFEKLLEALRPPRDLSRNPLFQILFVLHNTPQQALALPNLTVRPMEIDPGTARFDVSLEFWETPEGLQSRFEYSTDLFEEATIARMAGHLQTLLAGIVAAPEQRLSRLPLLTAAERHCLLLEWHTTTAPYPDNQCIHSVFETQVERTPDAVAVVCGDAFLTYSELNSRANQLAHYLQARGVGPEMLVGLCIERSLAMVVGLLGILKAGSAYVPLDPTYPRARLAFMLDDAQPPVVLTQEHLGPGLPDHGAQMICLDAQWPTIARYSNANPVSGVMADNVAYLLYTSGSTGRPKGVLGVHRATLNALAWMWQIYPFATHEVCCQKTPISFGDSIQELLGPLLQGRQLVLIPDDLLKELPRFVRTLAQHHVTRLILVPSLLRALLDTVHDLQDCLPSLTLWFAGGEALSSDLWQRFREQLPHCRLVNLYGASEASDDTTWYDTSLAPSALACVPIGRPIANTQVYVLDPHLQPVPIGVPGELYVGGASLTRSYLHHPDLTAERFIPHPFSREPGARLYKTGDLVRYRPDSHLEYVGRLDQQVKLRGIRIEPGEIEAALARHPAVRETAVIICEDVLGEPRLVAYVVPAQEPGPTMRELRHFLEKQLPAAMVPSTFMLLEALPLTPSGKVDRLGLPQPDPSRPALEADYIAPRTPVEQQVATIWCHLLGLERVGVQDNFFELGGHSLLAMQIVSRVRDATHVEVSLLHFFETPTVAGTVAIIEAGERTAQGLETQTLVPVPREGMLPASIAQEHFWVFDQLLPDLPLFNIPYVVRLVGVLDVATLEQSFNAIIERHEALRTTFASVDEQLVQVIVPTLHMRLTVRDLRELPETEREDEAQRLVQAESQRPFDLVQGPLLRGCLLRLGEQEYRLLVTLHHIISDGWSVGVLMRELAIVYDAFTTGQPSPLPALPIQYADFAAWQRQWQHNAILEAQLTYWQEQLREPLRVLALPTDHPREAAWYVRTARQSRELPSALYEALVELSRQEGNTLFMTCLAAFKILLYGYTGQEDLCVATLVANRTRQQTEGLVGLVVNTVMLRTDLGGNPLSREVLQRVRATTLAAYAHQDLPFEEVMRMLEGEHNRQRTALSQVMVVWHNAMLWPLQYSTPTLSFETMEQSVVAPDVALTTFDMILTLRERPQGLTMRCLYKTDLFEAATISQMLDDFQDVLACLSTRLEQRLAMFRSLRGTHSRS
jgi:amino acid adenylation domain-containing protein